MVAGQAAGSRLATAASARQDSRLHCGTLALRACRGLAQPQAMASVRRPIERTGSARRQRWQKRSTYRRRRLRRLEPHLRYPLAQVFHSGRHGRAVHGREAAVRVLAGRCEIRVEVRRRVVGGEGRVRRLMTGLCEALRRVLGVVRGLLSVLLALRWRSVPLRMRILSRIHRGGEGRVVGELSVFGPDKRSRVPSESQLRPFRRASSSERVWQVAEAWQSERVAVSPGLVTTTSLPARLCA